MGGVQGSDLGSHETAWIICGQCLRCCAHWFRNPEPIQEWGNLHFVEFATGINLAVKGLSSFQIWIKGTADKVLKKRYPNYASLIDTTSKSAAVVLIKNVLIEVQNEADRLFKKYSQVSWLSVFYGATCLYTGFSHPINLLIIFVWPIYIFHVKKMVRKKCKKKLELIEAHGKVEQEIDADAKQITRQIDNFPAASDPVVPSIPPAPQSESKPKNK